MEIREYQQKVDQWIKDFGVRYFDEKTNMILLVEEVGELSSLVARQFGEQSFKGQEPTDIDIKQHLGDEMADILFVLSCLANQMDINLEEAVLQNFNKKTSRDKDRHKNNPKLGFNI